MRFSKMKTGEIKGEPIAWKKERERGGTGELWGLEAMVGWSWFGARGECLVWKQAEQCAAAKPEI